MRTQVSMLTAGLLAAAVSAQLPMSKFVRSYNTTSGTRGFYFQAPVDFKVTHVQVPDESAKGTYLFALYLLSAAPPAFSQSVAATPVVYAHSIRSTDVYKLPTPVAYKKGEWLVVLGAAGATSGTISGSYGARGGDASFVLGNPVTIKRALMQAHIGTNSGVGNLSAEDAYEVARVRLYVEGGAFSTSYCTPSNGTADLDICDMKPALIGQPFALQVTPNVANTGLVLAAGITGPVNIPIPGFGTLCITPILLAGLPGVPATGAELPLGSIANDTTLIGSKVQVQAAIAAPNTPLTDAVEVTIGR